MSIFYLTLVRLIALSRQEVKNEGARTREREAEKEMFALGINKESKQSIYLPN